MRALLGAYKLRVFSLAGSCLSVCLSVRLPVCLSMTIAENSIFEQGGRLVSYTSPLTGRTKMPSPSPYRTLSPSPSSSPFHMKFVIYRLGSQADCFCYRGSFFCAEKVIASIKQRRRLDVEMENQKAYMNWWRGKEHSMTIRRINGWTCTR